MAFNDIAAGSSALVQRAARMAITALVLIFALAAPASAHDPFDASTNVVVFDERIEVTVTLGYDATRAYVATLALPGSAASRITRDGERTPIALPPQAAARLVRLSTGGVVLPARSFSVMPGEAEIPFHIVYPRPHGAAVQIQAAYFDQIADMRPGTVQAMTATRRLITRAMVSRATPDATLPLALATGAAGDTHGFAAYFTLGVTHILAGFDHLLFLAGLLIGLRHARSMLGVVSVFTLAHSVTLALAAFDVVVLPPHIVEPLIAVSIVVVAVDNIVRGQASHDRYWLAGAFGLIHGLGFAGALRDTMLADHGERVVVPLLGFNLGVESGQLIVAAMGVPLLLALRRNPRFARYGMRASSWILLAVSSAWLWQRSSG